MSDTTRLAGRRPGRVSSDLVARAATWSIMGLALISVTIRPLVEATGLPQFFVNLDALLTPFAACVVLGLTVLAWPAIDRGRRLLTLLVLALIAILFLSWLVSSPRTFAGLGLGAAMLILLPVALYLVVMAVMRPVPALARQTLVLMVLLQLAVGVVQYVALAVAQKAPGGADLVDGTTSHNFWPVFALPASLALVLSGRERWRWAWPVTVVLLSVYAEAKAALIVWLPPMVLLLAAEGFRGWRAHRNEGRLDRAPSSDRLGIVAGAGLAATAAAVVVVGLWWTPSVQGTWRVFLGHSESLEQFAVAGNEEDATGPTLREAVPLVAESATAGPRQLLLGLGPGNSASHAAEVLARGAKNGVSLPAPGPVATHLLGGSTDAIKFRDAQSSVLGVWGDLGLLGAVVYAGVCIWACYLLVIQIAPLRQAVSSPRAWSVPVVIGGLLAGGTLLDWPEQASVVLPVLLSLLVLTGSDAGGRDPRATDSAAARAGRDTPPRQAASPAMAGPPGRSPETTT